ncbi:MAG: FkbM family methyltransferase [Vicinamibacterales bacterium]
MPPDASRVAPAPGPAAVIADDVARRLLRLLPPSVVLPVIAGPLRGYRWITGAAPHGAWLGRLEPDLLRDFVAHIAPGDTVWDVGANVGLYTLAAARAAGPHGQVVAVEPIAANLSYLRRHLALNGLSGVEVVAAAACERDGPLRMAAGDSPSEYALAEHGAITVDGVRLDSMLDRAGARRPAVIKIDTEGAEGRILEGAARVLGEARPRLYLSLHGAEPAEACRRQLEQWDYAISTLSGAPPGPVGEWIAVPRAGGRGTAAPG